jgi:hypothetical protein
MLRARPNQVNPGFHLPVARWKSSFTWFSGGADNVTAVPRFGTWEPPATPSSGDAQPLQLIRNFSHAPTVVASEWMVSVIRSPPPTAVR